MSEYRVATSRFNRAVAHGEQLARLWNDVPTGRLCTPRAIIDPNGNGVLVASSVGDLPEEFSLLLGEMLYQLRSVLDACIYQATIYSTGKNPPPDEGQLEFPITKNSKEWPDLAKRRLMHLSQGIQDGIEKAQPYNAPLTSGGEPDRSVNRSLDILHDLARKDRHRALHVVGLWPMNLQPSFILPHGVAVASIEAVTPSIIKEGAVMAKFNLSGYQHGVEAVVNPRLRTTFGCAEPPLPIDAGDTFEDRLREITNSIAGVIDFFERNT